jgi:hypothetical protein
MMATGPVRAAVKAVGGGARHVAWWLRYRLHGQTHDAPPEPPRRPAAGRRSGE